MASSERCIRDWFSLSSSFFFLYFILWFGISDALKVPFMVNDVLPVLPRQVSWPVLNNLHSAVDLLPYFVGAVRQDDPLRWKGACFYGNDARLELTEGDEDDGSGGGVVYINTDAAHSWTCMDLYVFATPYRVTWDYYFTSREHKLEIHSWEEPAELEYDIYVVRAPLAFRRSFHAWIGSMSHPFRLHIEHDDTNFPFGEKLFERWPPHPRILSLIRLLELPDTLGSLNNQINLNFCKVYPDDRYIRQQNLLCFLWYVPFLGELQRQRLTGDLVDLCPDLLAMILTSVSEIERVTTSLGLQKKRAKITPDMTWFLRN